ncbi:MAG TPA: riboflavin synthase [Solirubrobacteraceae bacterium]|nr:riboflavin synthase [Solirubrobacteraceae bacterium]
MFTGLIARLGEVADIERDEEGATLTVRTALARELAPGDSIAVDGVCLTAVSVGEGSFSTQAMSETLRRSTLGELAVGARVNLELALRADGRLGGHVVQGHVDGTGAVAEVREEGFARVLGIELDPALERLLVEQGSIAVNGVSLTVSALVGEGFAVSLIPETRERTNLGGLAVGDRVNLEVDVLAKHVARLLEHAKEAV